MKSTLKINPLVLALQVTLAVALGYYAGSGLSRWFGLGLPPLAGMWCVISALIVMQVMMREALEAALLRIVGSLVGAVVAWGFASWLGYTVLALLCCVFFAVLLTWVCRVAEAFRLASLTAVIIIVVGMISPDLPVWQNSLSRFVESALGVGIAIILVLVFSKSGMVAQNKSR